MKKSISGAVIRFSVLLLLLVSVVGMVNPAMMARAEAVQIPSVQQETDPLQAQSGDTASDQPDGISDSEEPSDPDTQEDVPDPLQIKEPDDSQELLPPELPSDLPQINPAELTENVSVIMQSGTEGCALPASDVIPVTVQALMPDAPFTQHISSIACDRSVGTGSGRITFGPYTQPGIYRYSVCFGYSGLKDWIVDDAQEYYIAEVTVTLNEAGSGLEAQLQPCIALQDENGEYTVSGAAVASLTAVKTYREPLSISVTKCWPDGGERPVIIRLMEVHERTENGQTTKSEQEIGKVTLTKLCSWKHTFTANEVTGQLLHPDKEYVLDEVDMFKFAESYSYKKTDPLHWEVTVTNSEALYQTGPELRPIFFLLCCGMILMAAGTVLLRKQSANE